MLSTYIVWSIIQDEIPYLSKDFLSARKKYKERVLGTKGLRKRWKTCVAYTNEYLGEGLAETYVDTHFPKPKKTYVSSNGCSFLNTLTLPGRSLNRLVIKSGSRHKANTRVYNNIIIHPWLTLRRESSFLYKAF